MRERQRHNFDDGTDCCMVCGVSLYDNGGLGVGCEAGPEGNAPGYMGLALTPAERAAGVGMEDKLGAIFAGVPLGTSLGRHEYYRRLRDFNRGHHPHRQRRENPELRRDAENRRPPRGRPSRASLADPALVAAAPLPELVTEPADALCRGIRRMHDAELLTAMHEFESAHDRRKSVLEVLEHRLRWLDAPVPERPRCPLPPPWPEYGALRATPSARPVVRERLRRCSDAELDAAVAYELATKRRAVILGALQQEQHWREREARLASAA